MCLWLVFVTVQSTAKDWLTVKTGHHKAEALGDPRPPVFTQKSDTRPAARETRDSILDSRLAELRYEVETSLYRR